MALTGRAALEAAEAGRLLFADRAEGLGGMVGLVVAGVGSAVLVYMM